MGLTKYSIWGILVKQLQFVAKQSNMLPAASAHRAPPQEQRGFQRGLGSVSGHFPLVAFSGYSLSQPEREYRPSGNDNLFIY